MTMRGAYLKSISSTAEAKSLKIGMRVRWNALGRASFELRNPNIVGTLTHGWGYPGTVHVQWDGRASTDEVDAAFIEPLQVASPKRAA